MAKPCISMHFQESPESNPVKCFFWIFWLLGIGTLWKQRLHQTSISWWLCNVLQTWNWTPPASNVYFASCSWIFKNPTAKLIFFNAFDGHKPRSQDHQWPKTWRNWWPGKGWRFESLKSLEHTWKYIISLGSIWQHCRRWVNLILYRSIKYDNVGITMTCSFNKQSTTSEK